MHNYALFRQDCLGGRSEGGRNLARSLKSVSVIDIDAEICGTSSVVVFYLRGRVKSRRISCINDHGLYSVEFPRPLIIDSFISDESYIDTRKRFERLSQDNN